jgi:hypothetical protein
LLSGENVSFVFAEGNYVLPAFLISRKACKIEEESPEDVGKAPPSGRGEPGDVRKREEMERYDIEQGSGAVPHLRI